MSTNLVEKTMTTFEGHIKIYDPETKEIFCDRKNAIHYEICQWQWYRV